jgi:hypothetical protein
MMINNARRTERMLAKDQVTLSWEDNLGEPRFALVYCVNVSMHGIAIRFREPMTVRSYVRVRSEKLKLSGSASVKYCIRRNAWYQIGLEFTSGLKLNAMPGLAPA